MKVLSVTTSSNICGVAILEEETLIKNINIDNGLTHSESLMPTINQILNDTNISLKDINLLVVDRGPGSFTGIRIGISTIMAFSDSLRIPSIGISSLEALAYNLNTDEIVCSLIDAKNSNCYCGIYKYSNGNYILLNQLFADHIDNIVKYIKDLNLNNINFVGSGSISNSSILCNSFANCSISNNNKLNAYNLGLAGLHKFKSGEQESIMPQYLRKSQAERMAKNI